MSTTKEPTMISPGSRLIFPNSFHPAQTSMYTSKEPSGVLKKTHDLGRVVSTSPMGGVETEVPTEK